MLTTIIELCNFLSVYKVLKSNLFPLNYFSNTKNLIEVFTAIIIKTVWYLLNDKHSHLWNRIESPKID